MAEPASRPYEPLPDPPKDFTLHEALQGTQTPDGHWHVGKLEFENTKEYSDFRVGQVEIAGTKEQLATLYALETTGKIPGTEPMNAAPPGTTVEGLLEVKDKKPDDQGFYHLGTLKVQKDEFQQFADLQKDICDKNPEALAALYHMEHAPDGPVTFRVTNDSDRRDRYSSDTNTIHWNEHTTGRDSRNGARVDPGTAALHEETHWALRGGVGDTLASIPSKAYSDYNERAVIEGSEARMQDIEGHAKRHSHHGHVVPVRELDSVTPSLTIRQNGVEREVGPGFQQSGRVIGMKDGWVTLAVRGDGSQPEHRMDLKVDQLQGAFQNDVFGERVLLMGAQKHGDTVTISASNDGRIVYSDPAQEKRINEQHQPWPPYPKEMPQFSGSPDLAERPVVPSQKTELVGVGR
jgi:hypothetical protein